MAEEKKFGRWSLVPSDLLDMTPVKARDLIRKCFFEAQKETFARVRERAGIINDPQEIEDSVDRIVKHAFRETNGNYDDPTKEDIMRAVDALAKSAQSWGTPADIIDHHITQISEILAKLT